MAGLFVFSGTDLRAQYTEPPAPPCWASMAEARLQRHLSGWSVVSISVSYLHDGHTNLSIRTFISFAVGHHSGGSGVWR
jgi:hypothetical protein